MQKVFHNKSVSEANLPTNRWVHRFCKRHGLSVKGGLTEGGGLTDGDDLEALAAAALSAEEGQLEQQHDGADGLDEPEALPGGVHAILSAAFKADAKVLVKSPSAPATLRTSPAAAAGAGTGTAAGTGAEAGAAALAGTAGTRAGAAATNAAGTAAGHGSPATRATAASPKSPAVAAAAAAAGTTSAPPGAGAAAINMVLSEEVILNAAQTLIRAFKNPVWAEAPVTLNARQALTDALLHIYGSINPERMKQVRKLMDDDGADQKQGGRKKRKLRMRVLDSSVSEEGCEAADQLQGGWGMKEKPKVQALDSGVVLGMRHMRQQGC